MAYPTYRVRSKENVSGIDNAIIALINRRGSGKVVDIHNIDVRNVAMLASNTTCYHGVDALYHISDWSGGTDVSYTKYDSTNASLPSQVILKRNLISITKSSSVPFRRSANCPQANVGRATAFLTLYGLGSCGFNLGASYDTFDRLSGAVDRLTLREGQGMAYVLDSYACSNFYRIFCEFTVGGATYCVDEEVNFNQLDEPIFAIFNGSGSGVVIKVVRFEITENGDDTVPGFGVIPITDVYTGCGGEDCTPMPMDSANPQVPSQIVIRTDCPFLTLSSGTGYPASPFADAVGSASGLTGLSSSRKYYQDRYLMGPRYRVSKHLFSGSNPTLSQNGFAAAGHKLYEVLDCKVTVREGQGIAMVQMYNDVGLSQATGLGKSSRFNYNVGMTFSIRDNDVGSFVAPVLGRSPLIHRR